jgi:hypothetical protein
MQFNLVLGGVAPDRVAGAEFDGGKRADRTVDDAVGCRDGARQTLLILFARRQISNRPAGLLHHRQRGFLGAPADLFSMLSEILQFEIVAPEVTLHAALMVQRQGPAEHHTVESG